MEHGYYRGLKNHNRALGLQLCNNYIGTIRKFIANYVGFHAMNRPCKLLCKGSGLAASGVYACTIHTHTHVCVCVYIYIFR